MTNIYISALRRNKISMFFLFFLLGCSTNGGNTEIKNSQSQVSSEDISVKIYGNWCGPNYPIRRKGVTDPDVIDYVDSACKIHDACYEKKGYFNCECDMELLGSISSMESMVRRSRGSPASASLYGSESVASAASQIYYSLPLCTGGSFAVKAAISPFLIYRTGAGVVGGAAAEVLTLPLKGLWWALCPFSEQGCSNPP